jgi:hypothetical protein
MKKLLNTVQEFIKKLFKRDNPVRYQHVSFPIEVKPDSYFETPIKRYTKSELAGLYNRKVETLMSWINDNPELIGALKALSYKKSHKEFRKEHVRLIFTYLGEP